MALQLLQKHLSQIRSPLGGDKIYKDECVFSFDSPESETGLYVCLNTFLGFGREQVTRHYRKTGNAVYLHLRRIVKEIIQEKKDEEDKKITRLAIGVEGGFDVGLKKYEYEEINSVVILPDFAVIPLPNPDLPEIVQLSICGILAADSAAKLEEAQALAGTWDGEKRKVTKYADQLVQLNEGLRIPPRGWKCEQCDKVDNLWLNLTDGSILCGRRFFDGSGGNNHALEHYKVVHYPLAVKLGTITPDGADVFSYEEDDMVEDPHLTKHLAHFGINITQMEKTDKSMLELEIDINQRMGEWATIQEAGKELTPMYGPGYTGLTNLGNSCYLNSVIQVIFSTVDFRTRYFDPVNFIFDNAPLNPTSDLTVQMAKIGHGLLSGVYSQPPDPKPVVADATGAASTGDKKDSESQPGIKLHMFKSLIGKGHHEFSTKRQQDAQEFFLHLINVLERHNRNFVNPADCFKYQEENRILCVESRKVKYVNSTQYILRLPIPLESALNKDEVAAYEEKKIMAELSGIRLDPQQVVRAHIPMSTCFEAFAAPKTVPDFYSSALKAKSIASKTVRLATFPDYLMIQLEKFTFENGWIPKKLDVSIDVPDELDLKFLQGTGLQANEEELPDEVSTARAEEIQLDEMVLVNLAEMGFNVNACRRAVFNTGNQGLEVAMAWIMEHMNDADFADPFVVPGSGASGGAAAANFSPDEDAVMCIMGMGFTREQAVKALKATDNNVERAADWIFSHLDELDSEAMDVAEPPPPQALYRNGSSKYRLVAFISHMGTSTMVGHYVCHILKDGHWVIFNDNKVALSENPPKDLAYLYMYQRVSN